MISALISLALLIIPFGIDFAHSRVKNKAQKIKIERQLPIDNNQIPNGHH
jgi:hypothetical protein